MLATQSRVRLPAFTRRDGLRLAISASILIVALTAILSIDIIPTAYHVSVGDIAPATIRAPRAVTFVSAILTTQAQDAAVAAVPPQYDYTPQKGDLAAARQTAEFDHIVAPVDAAFGAVLSDAARRAALAGAMPSLSATALATLQNLTRDQWTNLRDEMRQVLDTTEQGEVRDSELIPARLALPQALPPALPADQRALAGEIMEPLLIANSSYDDAATQAARQAALQHTTPVTVTVKQDEVIVDQGHSISPTALEKIQALGLENAQPDPAKLAGWLLLSALVVALLLGWVWRYRPEFWHRNNALLLVGLLLAVAVLALKLTAGRSLLPFFIPVAAVGLLLTILLDSGSAIVVLATLSVLAGAVSGTVELSTYVFLGGLVGIVALYHGDRFHHFVQAAVAMAIVNGAVVAIFTLLGERDLTGVLQLWGASVASAGGASVVAVGSFAVLGNLFGITTSFQLLELANPSQPLLRRLLLETPGTYHHSLMVGNLAERAAEAIGADPLLGRVAAYYHDIGKLANPTAFIENQANIGNVHDLLTPEESTAVLKAHVANGIDLAYQYGLPKAIIAFIPQHHGTALMSYFYAKAQEQAVAAAGAVPGSPEAEAVATSIDQARFRHAGPKPQSREAAILMLADGVEASVRSLTGHDEASIRAMVNRIIRERLEDGQFDECDLTLRDLERIREAFVAQLLGMYHRRIEYPQNKVVELESRRTVGAGRS
ncbi:MAG: HDIG domain-containing protein [Chloroflexi bacterium]|nr:HDIG domain-containing protein [Chloroflexota bacterium]